MARTVAPHATVVAEARDLAHIFPELPIDDLHWANVASIRLLQYLAGRLTSIRLALVATGMPRLASTTR